MPVEFALRPRIRLRESSPLPKRSRVRLPRFALPVALYWAVAGGITYAFVHEHEKLPLLTSEASNDRPLDTEPAPREARPWWRPVREASTSEPAAPSAAPTVALGSTPDLASTAAMPTPAPDPVEQELPATADEPLALPAPPRAREAVVSPATRPTLEPKPPEPARAPIAIADEPPTFHEAPEAPAPAPVPAPSAARNNGLPSCEAAVESAHQDIDFSQGNGTADLPTSAIAAVLENGAWLGSCSVPASTSLDVCVAIRGGSVIGASVVARPANAEVTACVRRRASALQFPYSTHVDIARTRF